MERPGSAQFVTWRLADAMPSEAIERWREELCSLEDSARKREIARRIEAYCDAGHGACFLGVAAQARLVQEVLFSRHLRLYDLHAWCIMPNHVHALLTPNVGVALSEVMRQVKGASSAAVNRSLSRSGRLWQREYHDRWMRDEVHFWRTLRYIEWNPVKAKLCRDHVLWSWSSANENARARLEVVAAETKNLILDLAVVPGPEAH